MLAIAGFTGVKPSLNPPGAKVHAPEPVKAYSPWRVFLYFWPSAHAGATAINIANAIIITSGKEFERGVGKNNPRPLPHPEVKEIMIV
jgi:hypothetical protein